jgi:hypothetical protein
VEGKGDDDDAWHALNKDNVERRELEAMGGGEGLNRRREVDTMAANGGPAGVGWWRNVGGVTGCGFSSFTIRLTSLTSSTRYSRHF